MHIQVLTSKPFDFIKSKILESERSAQNPCFTGNSSGNLCAASCGNVEDGSKKETTSKGKKWASKQASLCIQAYIEGLIQEC